MKQPITFICNTKKIDTMLPPGTAVLDFLREHEHLRGTKAACREGDCGSCSILVGTLTGDADRLNYTSMTSCLLPLGDMEGKHIVSIEGINPDMESTMSEIPVTPVQRMFIEEGATQCGFCTPGFVISLTYFLLKESPLTVEAGLEAVSGNICRCTGYGSIKRSIIRLVDEYGPKVNKSDRRLEILIEEGIVPSYFKDIPERLRSCKSSLNSEKERSENADEPADQTTLVVAGGTDLYVQKPDLLPGAHINFISSRRETAGISREGTLCRIGAGTTMEQLKDDEILRDILPDFHRYLHLIASTQIRQRATVGGNIINASPIGDVSVFLLSLGAVLGLGPKKNNGVSAEVRRVPLSEFYLGYKKLDLEAGEILVFVEFEAPGSGAMINFEKVSRRTHLDIASVNSGIRISTGFQGGAVTINDITISAGGVAPIPLVLSKTADFCRGKKLSIETVRKAAEIGDSEITPISDVRGSEQYKRLLLRQLFFAHFISLYPDTFAAGGLL